MDGGKGREQNVEALLGFTYSYMDVSQQNNAGAVIEPTRLQTPRCD